MIVSYIIYLYRCIYICIYIYLFTQTPGRI